MACFYDNEATIVKQKKGLLNRLIYLDNAATTRMAPEVLDAMMPYLIENFANPSGIYTFGQKSRQAISSARYAIAQVLEANENEIYFTSGGSESDNWALRSVAEAYQDKGNHLITTKIEHPAILNTCAYLEQHGFCVTYLDVDSTGKVDLDELRKAILPTTILISVMAANNEIGTIEPIFEIGKIAHEHQVLFHTDAVQVFGHLPISTEDMPIDLLSASAHKLNGPKGIGFLYIRNGLKLHSLILGGAQERKRRAGTENVPGIVGFGKAAELSKARMQSRKEQEMHLKSYLWERLFKEVPQISLNGDAQDRLSNNLNVYFNGVSAESLLIALDMAGICASSGSACASGSLDPSHVLLAIGLNSEAAKSSLRLTLSSDNTKDEIDMVVNVIKNTVNRQRSRQHHS